MGSYSMVTKTITIAAVLLATALGVQAMIVGSFSEEHIVSEGNVLAADVVEVGIG
jgi:hypothetical protein